MFKDTERSLEALFRDERVSERAVGFTSTFGAQANVLGASPKTRLASWTEEEARTYPLVRTEPWEPDEARNDDEHGVDSLAPRFIPGAEPPPELRDSNLRSHHQIETVSVIRERLWDRAEWVGTASLMNLDNKYPPFFGLVFRNREAAREIFVHWRKELGAVDEQEQIRLSIVKGVDKRHPHAYRVIVGSDPTTFPAGSRFVTFVSRIRLIEATTPDNLDRFLQAHDANEGAYFLAPAFAPPDLDDSKSPGFDLGLRIGKRDIHVRQAWEIGRNEIEAIAIHKDDDPIIPDGIESPPVLELLNGHRTD